MMVAGWMFIALLVLFPIAIRGLVAISEWFAGSVVPVTGEHG